MPTRRGWSLLGAGSATLALWYFIGDSELLLVGSFLLVAVLLAWAYVAFAPTRVTVSRRLGSEAIHDGDTVSIGLVIESNSKTTVRNLTIEDGVEGRTHARFELAALRPSERSTATYRLTCRPRGVFRLGPSQGWVTDPLGLVEVGLRPGTVDRLVVYPYVEDLEVSLPKGSRAPVDARRPDQVHRGGEDFDTLREYQKGDDLRRIHWPSSARADRLMIRQLDAPWQSRALVVLDARTESYESSDAFETAVSGAASVLSQLVKAGHAADLWTTDSEPVDAGDYSGAMEKLAAIGARSSLDIVGAAAEVRSKGGGGALILVTGVADRPLLDVHGLLSPDYSHSVVMSVASTTPQALGAFQRLGALTIQVPPGSAWSLAWKPKLRSKWDVVSAR